MMRPASRPTRRPASARSHLHHARRLGTLLVALVIILPGCAAQPADGSPRPGGPPSPPSASASATPPAVRLAAPASRLLVRSWTCLMCIYSMGTMVFDDGLVVTDGRDDGAIRARHLSPEGIAWRSMSFARRSFSRVSPPIVSWTL